jgi:hypothetical protein
MGLKMKMVFPTIDADEIYPGLWQGGRPPLGDHLREAGFSLLVLCARENQHPPESFPGVEVVGAPNDDNFDNPPTREQLQRAKQAANQVIAALQKGRQVLVTCYAGINRSGLVSALVLHDFLGVSGVEACMLIQRARPIALTNPQFLNCLSKLPSKPGIASPLREWL